MHGVCNLPKRADGVARMAKTQDWPLSAALLDVRTLSVHFHFCSQYKEVAVVGCVDPELWITLDREVNRALHRSIAIPLTRQDTVSRCNYRFSTSVSEVNNPVKKSGAGERRAYHANWLLVRLEVQYIGSG